MKICRRAQTCPAVVVTKNSSKVVVVFLPTNMSEMFLNANQIGRLDHLIGILFWNSIEFTKSLMMFKTNENVFIVFIVLKTNKENLFISSPPMLSNPLTIWVWYGLWGTNYIVRSLLSEGVKKGIYFINRWAPPPLSVHLGIKMSILAKKVGFSRPKTMATKISQKVLGIPESPPPLFRNYF